MKWFSDLWDRLVVNYQSTVTGLVVLVFTWASDHGIDVSQDNQKVATAKILAVALSLFKLFGKDAPTPEEEPKTGSGSSGFGSAGRSLALPLAATLFLAPLSACARRDGDAAYKKAFYSAHVVYGLDALGDLFEIFKDGGVLGADGFKKSIEVTNDGLIAYDELVELLEKGWPVGSFDKARTVIERFKSAVANGAIKFNSPKAQSAYANTVATIEVTVNLLEAINAGRKGEVKRLEAEQKAKATAAKASIAQADPAWYQSAIVRGSRLATELSILSSAETVDIWSAVRQRSAEAHVKNRQRLGL